MSAEVTSAEKAGMGPGRFALQASGDIFQANLAYYAGLKKAKEEGRPIIYEYGVTPREIFHTVDAPTVFLEHVPFVLGLLGVGSHYMQIAEEHGFSKDVCAAHRCFLGCGAAKENEREPVWDQFYVAPDLIVAGNLPCISESKAFLYLADHYKCPYYFIDTPINSWGMDPPDFAIEYTAGQLKGALDFMGEQGFNVDRDKLKETVRLTKQVLMLWREINDLKKTPPTVMSPMDSLVTALLLIQILPPAQVLTLLEKVLKEVKEKKEKKEGLVEDEKVRLMFWGLPPVFNMQLLDSVEKYGAVWVTYMLECATGGAFDPSYIDPEMPLESIARRTLIDIVNPISSNMVEHTVQDAKDFKIDGVVVVVKRSCGLIPGFARQIKDAVYKGTGKPTTIFDLDGLDSREYDDATIRNSLDSFIETLLASKK